MYNDPYKKSSTIYDLTSRFVPYDFWADYIYQILDKHNTSNIQNILELSCGTGSFRTFFQTTPNLNYFCSDISLGMLQGAQIKFFDTHLSNTLLCQDNKLLGIKSQSMELVIMLFDSINYMTHDHDIISTFNEISRVLKSNGLFIFDFTTPANSLENLPEDFSEWYEENNTSFVRISKYDHQTQLHSTIFELNDKANKIIETHTEKTYTIKQMTELINQSPKLELVAQYDEFDFIEPTENSQRLHVVLRKR